MSSSELHVLEHWLNIFHDGTLLGIVEEGTTITLEVECLWLLESLINAPAFVRLRLIDVERISEEGLPLVDADLMHTEVKDGWVMSWFDYDDVATELHSFWWKLRAREVRCERPDGREVSWNEMVEAAESSWSSYDLPGKRVMIAEAPNAVSMPFFGEPFGLFVAQFGEPIEVAERGKWADAITASACVLTAAWGAECSAWDDDVDHALVVQNLDRGSDRLIMTTWHEQETLAEALEFFFRDAFGENGRPHYYAILVFGASYDQLNELRADCLVAMEALS